MIDIFAKAAKQLVLAWRHSPVAVVIIVAMSILVVVDFGLVMFVIGALSAS